MWRHVAANALTFLIVGLFLLGGVVLWGSERYRAPGPLETAICLKVEPGSTFRQVSRSLEEQGAVSHGAIFRIGADYSGKATQLKAGSFLVPAGASMSEIVDTVTRGGRNTCGTEVIYTVGISSNAVSVRELDPATNRFEDLAKFTPGVDEPPAEYEQVRASADTRYFVQVIEGATAWQVVSALNDLDLLTEDMTDIPAEGTLAPDSYEILPGDSVASVVGRMAAEQAEFLAAAWQSRSEDLSIETPEEALILASIVEKETAIPEERPVVAGILHNRIREGWRLQFDPTIIYGITRGVGVLGREISQSDIDGKTERDRHGSIEYNTYQIDGLPKGPIGNPGRGAIEAVLNPAVTDYMFFVAKGDGSGGHAFAVTLGEHNENRARLAAAQAGGN